MGWLGADTRSWITEVVLIQSGIPTGLPCEDTKKAAGYESGIRGGSGLEI